LSDNYAKYPPSIIFSKPVIHLSSADGRKHIKDAKSSGFLNPGGSS
jgi:hypothetical protein